VIRDEPEVVTGIEPDEPPDTGRERFRRRFRGNRPALLAAAVILLAVLAAVFGPLLWTASPSTFDPLTAQLDAFPSAAHPLGTDHLGRDLLARLLAGLRVSLLVVALVESLNVSLGLLTGVVAGYFRGTIDEIFLRISDILFAFPGLLLAILLAGVFGQHLGNAYGGLARLALVSVALAVVSWPLMARYVRAETLSLRTRDYVEAARVLGTHDGPIIRHHIVPNVIGIVLTAATLDMAGVVVNEALLSFLGLGVQPPGSSIGLMISDGINQLGVNWLETFFPGVALTVLVLAFSFLADGLRDALDVRG